LRPPSSSDVDHGFLAETLHAGWEPAERQLLPETPIIFELRTMIEDRPGG
jgi:hypothetical protein